MTIERKLLGTSPSGGAADVAEVFSTYLYKGNGGGSTFNIVNNIDLAGEGGLVWSLKRTGSNHMLNDTELGVSKVIYSNGNYAPSTVPSGADLISFNSDGYSLGSSYNGLNSAEDWVSWAFRKKKKFFDVVTWTGNGANRTIAHSLDGAVGMILVKCTSDSHNWAVYHRTLNNGYYLRLNSTQGMAGGAAMWNSTAATDTVFTVGTDAEVNGSGKTYVAYVFADNSSEDADDQMIKCGSYTGSGGSGVTVNLGWEAQWVMVKKSSATSDWKLMDNMRGMPTPSGGRSLKANDSAAEGGDSTIRSDSRGFTIYPGSTFDASGTYIYMAIRAPMMKEPEAATDVFVVDAAGSGVAPAYISGFPVDFAIYTDAVGGGGNAVGTRMLGNNELFSNTTAAVAASTAVQWDYSSGFYDSTSRSANYYAWMWKRAKGYMDVVAYTGDTNSGRTVAHSLGVAPEMMWVKCRTDTTSWMVYHAALTSYKFLVLNTTAAPVTHNGNWYNTDPTDSVFTVGDGATNVAQGQIAYLFATLAGISKVGSYTGNGSSQTIDCGFSAGSRFILIKRTDTTGHWHVWDSVRGIVAGNDPHFSLKSSGGQVTTDDSVDPANSGFIVNQNSATDINVSSGTYIFYAIA